MNLENDFKSIEEKLAEPEKEQLLVFQPLQKEITIGAPHHAPAGIKRLPCNRPADQNTGYLALWLANLLKCSALIATNATVDPNKKLNSKYAQALIKMAPNYLVEIHGHGSEKANFEIEISAGSNERNNWSSLLADNLSNQLKESTIFNKFTVSGDFQSIYFKATRTSTIQHKDWLGIHIELPLKLRKEKNNSSLPKIGKNFTKLLATAIIQTISNPPE